MSRVLHAIRSTPWAIQPDALETIAEIAARENVLTPEAIERMKGERLADTRRVTVRDGVAIIPVRGPLFRYANLFTAFSGATSTEVLANDIGKALADPSVVHIVLDVDSPGGMVNGTAELAELIYRARDEKPITTFVSGLGASGAYWIGSAASRVFVERTAIPGSIGAVFGVTDFKKADEMEGVRRIEFVSAQSPRKRMDAFDENPARRADAREALQTLVDDLAQVFIEAVARHRGVDVSTVLEDFGQGGVFVGEAAVEAGLADGVTTLEDLIADIKEDRRPRGTVGLRPAADSSPPQNVPDEQEEPLMSDKTKAAEPTPVTRATLDEEHQELVSEIRAEGATAERERILAIQALEGPDEVIAECVADPTVSAGDAALAVLEASRAQRKAQADAHLGARAKAEEDLDAPPPSAVAEPGSGDRARAKRIAAIHNESRGRQAPARA